MDLRFVDTHTHPYDEAFDADRDAAMQRAISQGVTKWILPAVDSSTYQAQHSLYTHFPENAFMAMGLHPTSVGDSWREELDFVEAKLDGSEKYVAIGEVGLDGYWSKEFMQQQIEVLSAQIDMSIKYHLPLIIHLRQATEELFDLLESKPHDMRGVFHAFGGSYETYQRIKKYGDFKIGIGGVVTFKNAAVAESVKKIPLQDLLLETDAPWLTPSPHRGERNESSYIPIIANKIAQIKGCDLEQVAIATTQNAESLFAI